MLTSPDNGIPVLQSAEARRRRLVMPLVIALAIVALIAALLAAGSPRQLAGAGSTLAQPLVERASVDYRNAANADNPDRPAHTGRDWTMDGSGLDYEPVGSMGGIMRLSEGQVGFAVSDYPLSEQALTDLRAAQFPVALGAVAVAYNVDLPPGQGLRLDAVTLADIYLGRVTTWNDPAIARLNPGVTLPAQPIEPLYRTDGSGSAFGLTTYLSAGSAAWRSGPGTGALVRWPHGTGVSRSGGMVSALGERPGSIGFVEIGQAQRAGLRVAQLRNGAGAFTAPEPAAMRAATTGMDWSGARDYVGLATSADQPGAYPVTVAIYAVMKRGEQRETRRTLGFFAYLLDSSDASAADLGYLPLPQEAVDSVKTYWATAFTAS